MIRLLSFFITVLLAINTYAQISFEKGYYIDNNNQKVSCLIKNVDWRNNPTEFEYKLSEDSQVSSISIDLVKEFGINNTSKYVRALVEIDKSSDNIDELSKDKNPEFEEAKLFLKVLVEGEASLFQYRIPNSIRFFYKKDTSVIEQLIFKRYKSSENKIGENNRFKQQLWNNLKCSSFSTRRIENLVYKKNSLIKFFTEYNQCKNSSFSNFEKKVKKDLFNLTLRTGLNITSLSIKNDNLSSGEIDFSSKLGLRLGIEAEFILPFNKNKWTIIIEPTYQYFKSELERQPQNVSIDYTSIELPIGLRYYSFLNDDSKIYINSLVIVDITNNNSKVNFESARSLDLGTRPNLAIGLGYKYINKYSFELRYHTSREILNNQTFWNSKYKNFSIILGYSLL